MPLFLYLAVHGLPDKTKGLPYLPSSPPAYGPHKRNFELRPLEPASAPALHRSLQRLTWLLNKQGSLSRPPHNSWSTSALSTISSTSYENPSPPHSTWQKRRTMMPIRSDLQPADGDVEDGDHEGILTFAQILANLSPDAKESPAIDALKASQVCTHSLTHSPAAPIRASRGLIRGYFVARTQRGVELGFCDRHIPQRQVRAQEQCRGPPDAGNGRGPGAGAAMRALRQRLWPVCKVRHVDQGGLRRLRQLSLPVPRGSV
jgi:hypothetical protein